MTRTRQDLQMLQALPLDLKVPMTKARIRQWVNEFGEEGVYVSFSGGKDSTVLLHLVREMYPRVPAVFCDTGLEYPEIRDFVKTFDNVTWLRPKMNFRQVIEKYGYPFISKEVSECVYGARRYLRGILNEENPTQPTPQNHITIPKYGRGSNDANSGTVWEDHGSSQNSQGLLQRAVEQTGDYGKVINNMRVQKLLGILSKNGMVTAETIPSEEERSTFSQERYEFLLNAPFEVGANCCSVMKKTPFKNYNKETGRVPITAQMASESRLRTQVWLKHGCNAFDAKKKMSNPMSFWTEQDVLLYIYLNNIKIAPVYGEVVKEAEVDGQMDFADMGLFEQGMATFKTTGCNRTGCMFCGYGCHREQPPSRFERIKETHPKQYNYIMKPWDEGGLGYKEVIDWINEHGNLNIRY